MRLQRAVRSRLSYALLAIIAVVHVGLVVSTVRARDALDHDEVISQLAVSGHLDDWQRVIRGGKPTGTWASGRDLRRFLEIDSRSSLAEVADNLGHLDRHPPLYFWTVRGARSAGIGILWSGPIINLVAVVLAGALLFSLLAEVLKDRLLAAIAIGVFAFSPAVVRAVAVARPYPFLMLAAVGLIWVTTRLLRNPTSLWLLLSLFGVGVFGLLTETVFAFALAGALVTVAVRWSRTNLRAVAYACVAAIGSGLVALALFPSYFTQYSHLRTDANSFPPTSTVKRIRLWVTGFDDLAVLQRRVDSTFEVVAFVAVVALVATLPLWYRAAWRTIRAQPAVAAAVGVGGVVFVGATAAFVLGRTPPHAAGWQYVIVFWPSIVLVAAAIVGKLPSRHAAATLVVAAAMVGAFALTWQQDYTNQHEAQRRAVKEVSGATVVIADCLMRGYTPGAALFVPRDSRLLLAAPGEVRPPPIPPGADLSRPVLLDGPRCKPAVRNVDRLLATLGFTRGRSVGPIGNLRVFRLEPRADTP